jgi:hypothetical protein
MKLKGKYKQKYSLDRKQKELVVDVELKQIPDFVKTGQNIWYGVATANGKEIQHKDLPYCVNAECMAERIGLEIIEAWKIRAEKQGKSLRLKRK